MGTLGQLWPSLELWRTFIREWVLAYTSSSADQITFSFWAQIRISVPPFNALKSETFVLCNCEKKGDVQEKVVLYAEVELEVISRDVFYLSVKQNAHLWCCINNNNNVITSLYSVYCNLFILQNSAMKVKIASMCVFSTDPCHFYFIQTCSLFPRYKAHCI